MKIKGMNYDVGIQFEFGNPVTVNNHFSEERMKKDFDIIKNELGCTAVRLSGTDVDEIIRGSELVLQAGLDCWVSPHYIDAPIDIVEEQTLECARRSEELRKKYPENEVVFIYGCEMHHFAPFLPGNNFMERLASIATPGAVEGATAKLNEYFARTIPELRKVFKGRVTYCTVWFEVIDWTPFDIICLDHYKDQYNRNEGKYIADLKLFTGLGKPLVITEIGYCTFKGCSDHGANGFSICHPSGGISEKGDRTLNDVFERAEDEQAAALVDALGDIDSSGAEGAFAFTFVYDNMPHIENDPICDMDLGGFAIVKTFPDNKDRGQTFHGTNWEPKEAFYALKKFNEEH